jgi:hypothetical protein
MSVLVGLVGPGTAQAYKGRIRAAVIWFVVVIGCYLWVGPPAALVHLMCVITAGTAARVLRRPVLYEGMGWPKR